MPRNDCGRSPCIIYNMSTRYVFIALAVVLCAGALLYSADYQSLRPTPPQSSNLFSAR